MSHPNEIIVRKLYEAFTNADMTLVDELLDDGVIWHSPGNGQHAGVRHGKAELYAAMGRLAELTAGTLRSEVLDVLANDRRAAVLQLTLGQRDGRLPLHDREVLVYELRDGRVAEVWEHPGDLHAMDAFFA